MKPARLITLGLVAVGAIATYSYWTRSANDADPIASAPEAPENGATVTAPSDGAAAGSASSDTSTNVAATRVAPGATAAVPSAAPVAEAAPTRGLVSEQSPSPFVREVVRSFGGSGIPAGPLHDELEEFAASPADPISATTLEPRLLSAISQSSTAVVDRRVECTATACGMLLVYPLGTDQSAVRDEVDRLAPSLGVPRGETMAIFWPRADGAPSALVIYRLLRESTPQSVVARSLGGRE
jgi:hypothetical protein